MSVRKKERSTPVARRALRGRLRARATGSGGVCRQEGPLSPSTQTKLRQQQLSALQELLVAEVESLEATPLQVGMEMVGREFVS